MIDRTDNAIGVNLVGIFKMIRLAAEAMCKNAPEATGERGALINTASVAAYDSQIGQIDQAPACPSPAAWALRPTTPRW